MSEERCYIAPSRRKSAREKRWREEGGRHGHAIYREKGDSLSVSVHPRDIRIVNETRND
jgi:hypothetical protein